MNKFTFILDTPVLGISELTLPVNPGIFHIQETFKHYDIDIPSLETISLPGLKDNTMVTFEAFFPAVFEKDYCVYSGFPTPLVCKSWLQQINDTGTPVRFIISGSSRLGLSGAILNDVFTIRNFEWGDHEGEPDAIYYSLQLKRYRKPTIKKVSSGAVASTELVVRPEPVKADSAGVTYTVVSGDCLWNIAKKFLGNGAKYTEIYNNNKALIDARNAGKSVDKYTIYPGQVLKI